MSITLHGARLALALTVALTLLPACRQQPAPEVTVPTAPADPASTVAPSTDLSGASDQPDAAPAIGALTAGQASGGARGGTMQPTGGDGSAAGAAASAPASGASRGG